MTAPKTRTACARRWRGAEAERDEAEAKAKLRALALLVAEEHFEQAASDAAGWHSEYKNERREKNAAEARALAAEAEITRLKEEMEALGAALKPFCFGDPTLENILFGNMPDDATCNLTVKLRDTRRARSALATPLPEGAPVMSTKTTVHVIVSGPVGCGKSALVEEIAIALKAIGVEVGFADPRAVQSERNMVGDHIDSLEIYRDGIRVEVSESCLFTESQIEARIGGAYDMAEVSRQFWIDAPVAREIARRALGTSPSSNDRLAKEQP